MSAVLLSPAAPLVFGVTPRQQHELSATLTDNPVETGGTVQDHYVIKPIRLVLEVAAELPQITWQLLKRVIEDGRPFTVVTGLDVYRSMMIESVVEDRDHSTSRILNTTINMKEVKFATTARVAVTGDNASSASGISSRTGGGSPATSARGGATRPQAANTSPGTITQDRASDTVHRGDSPTVDAPTTGTGPAAERNRSILSSIL